MGTGWRRAFCTSIRRDPAAQQPADKQHNPTPTTCSKFGGLFSAGNHSTPRFLSQTDSAASTPGLRCRTNKSPPPPAAPGRAEQNCKTETNPCTPPSAAKLFPVVSNPSSPISPSRFALLRATLRLSRSRCGICAQSVKTTQGTAVFTAECSHSFHFSCIQSQPGCVVCPVCSTAWRQTPFLSNIPHQCHPVPPPDLKQQTNRERWEDKRPHKRMSKEDPTPKLYDDDEPLSGSCAGGGSRFSPIPEEEANDEDAEHMGLSLPQGPPSPSSLSGLRHNSKGVEVSVVPVAAMVSQGRSHNKYVIALKVKAPSMVSVPLPNPSHRAPVDLVTVLDVGGSMTGRKLQMLKRAVRLLISSLGPADRLSLVAFSSCAKRLLPLRRMSQHGQRSARHIVDRLVVCGSHGQSACVSEALRKATKVLEDRREQNPVATVVLLSDGQREDENKENRQRHRHPSSNRSAPTRLAHLEIPIHDSGFGDSPQSGSEDAFVRCVGGLLSVVLQHVQLIFPFGEISAVYSCGGGSCGGRAVALGAGNSIRLGDLYAEEERELLVELRVPAAAVGGHEPNHFQYGVSVTCSYRDPATLELVRGTEQRLNLPPLHPHPSTTISEEQLRNLFVSTRALAESRRLAELGDYGTAIHLLTSARSVLLQSASISSADSESLLRSLEAEIAGTQLRRHQCQQQQLLPAHRRTELREQAMLSAATDGDADEVLTPTSAWRAAERLAKVAIMRKSLNRVSDLHGFENARF